MSSNTEVVNYLIEMRETIEQQKFFFIEYLEEGNETTVSCFQQIIADLDKTLRNIDNTLKAECCHIYESDWIDIDPDRSEKITYCKICNCTF